jgi:transposase
MKTPKPKIIELSVNEWERILQHTESGPLNEAEREILRALGESYIHLLKLLEDKGISINRLRKLIFGSGSEKTREVIPQTPAEPPPASGEPSDQTTAPAVPEQEKAAPVPGHGRNGADDYPGAERIEVAHGSLKHGDPCPDCTKGKLYRMGRPGVLIRIVGQAPVQASIYELERLRCNLCDKVFTATPPEGVGEEKYDATAGSMIAVLKYGTGMPFHRLERLQEALGIPLPASTQWEIVEATAGRVEPAYEELIRQAAQGEVLHNDDTTVKILEFMGKRARPEVLAMETPVDPSRASGSNDGPASRRTESDRHGMFTSGIVSTSAGRRIALFFSGRRHAGENLDDVLAHRAKELPPPIQMCDALSRNLPAAFKTLLANCLAHGRRQFVDVAERFPEECRHVLESLGSVYRNDAIAHQRSLSPEDRLAFHQAESGPIMEELQAWCRRQIEDRLVEPNSALGEAISYLLRHWEKLTLFLRQVGAPLDNNIVERALKKAILHRKNALFYRTLNGAHVGDVFMSLIHTCELCEADPFGYLTELQRHAAELRANPGQWMPWNYRENLAATPPD